MSNFYISQLRKLVKSGFKHKKKTTKKKKTNKKNGQKADPVVEVDAELEEDEEVDWGFVYSPPKKSPRSLKQQIFMRSLKNSNGNSLLTSAEKLSPAKHG